MTGLFVVRFAKGFALSCLVLTAWASEVPEPIAVESNGIVAVEAEDFVQQRLADVRAWYRTDAQTTPNLQPDPDPPHVEDASGGAYLEILPDTRRTHDDPLVKGESFSNEPGKLAVIDFPIQFTTPGRYYVWARVHSTGTEDNGLHVGLNGEWPDTGRRMQWCKGKRTWRWESKQRTRENHCGEPYKIYLDIPEPGVYTVSFSMREDGVEFDKFLLINRQLESLDGPSPEDKLTAEADADAK